VYLLDTDHMSLLDRGGEVGETLRTRLRTVPPDDAATTIISYEEQTRGWMARIAQTRTTESQIALYRQLKRQLLNYCQIAVVDFDEKAAGELDRLRQSRVRIGTMDLKIAAIALANDATLLTRNLSDFRKVPHLRVEDWTV
jgi:tRNA(fMet)-specific endonuclease VapC